MSEMVYRVAQAIRDVNENTVGLTFRQLSEAMAVAAIEAMREPTDEVVRAVDSEWGPALESSYQRMIDAARRA